MPIQGLDKLINPEKRTDTPLEEKIKGLPFLERAMGASSQPEILTMAVDELIRLSLANNDILTPLVFVCLALDKLRKLGKNVAEENDHLIEALNVADRIIDGEAKSDLALDLERYKFLRGQTND